MGIEFYDVRKREKVQVPESLIKKTKYERTTKSGKLQVRYAFKAEVEGSTLTKFVSQTDWQALQAPEI